MLKALHEKLSTGALTVVAGIALLLHLAATQWLNASYAASKFPVPYQVAQLSFDGQKIKAWYGYLINLGTLNQYWQTQFVDFAFIATVLVLHIAALWLVARLFAPGSRGRRWLMGAATLSIVAPLADAAENLVSFAMLANPLDFPDSLALAYSTLAAIKFVFFAFAYVVFPVGLVAGLGQRWLIRRKPAL